jgi:hypothetical protein
MINSTIVVPLHLFLILNKWFGGTCASNLCFHKPQVAPKTPLEGWETRRGIMVTKQVTLACFAAIVLGVGAAKAGPCNTGGKDAGSGPTPGYTGQTTGTGSAKVDQHPPTETMNRVAGEKATSSQDAQRQQQGQPTAAQQAQGAKPSAQTADQGC